MSKITHFRVMQMFEAHSADCHSVEAYAMSHFGTTDLPDHVKVEITSVTEDEDAKHDDVNHDEPEKEADGQAPDTAAE